MPQARLSMRLLISSSSLYTSSMIRFGQVVQTTCDNVSVPKHGKIGLWHHLPPHPARVVLILKNTYVVLQQPSQFSFLKTVGLVLQKQGYQLIYPGPHPLSSASHARKD